MGKAIMGGDGEWKQSLFGCTSDIGNCLMGWCCGSCLYGQISDIVDDKGCFQPCCLAACCGPCNVCCYAPQRRDAKFRTHFLLNPGSCVDSACMTWFFCGPCANCQEMSELKERDIKIFTEYEKGAITGVDSKKEVA